MFYLYNSCIYILNIYVCSVVIYLQRYLLFCLPMCIHFVNYSSRKVVSFVRWYRLLLFDLFVCEQIFYYFLISFPVIIRRTFLKKYEMQNTFKHTNVFVCVCVCVFLCFNFSFVCLFLFRPISRNFYKLPFLLHGFSTNKSIWLTYLCSLFVIMLDILDFYGGKLEIKVSNRSVVEKGW